MGSLGSPRCSEGAAAAAKDKGSEKAGAELDGGPKRPNANSEVSSTWGVPIHIQLPDVYPKSLGPPGSRYG